MKFCTKCGAVIEDSCVVCPQCGNSTNSKISNVQSNNSNSFNPNVSSLPSNDGAKTVLMIFSILGGLAFGIGIILLAIGGYQEFMFRNEYDLSNLSEAGIKLARSLSKYANSINFLTAGGICAGVGLLLDIIVISYRSMINKNK